MQPMPLTEKLLVVLQILLLFKKDGSISSGRHVARADSKPGLPLKSQDKNFFRTFHDLRYEKISTYFCAVSGLDL